MNFQTGKVIWSVDGFKAGSITLVNQHLLLIQRESGELVMAETLPKYKPIATAKVLPAVVRSFPAIAAGRYYVRNEKTLVCLNLK